jgi:hypothetical protein
MGEIEGLEWDLEGFLEVGTLFLPRSNTFLKTRMFHTAIRLTGFGLLRLLI